MGHNPISAMKKYLTVEMKDDEQAVGLVVFDAKTLRTRVVDVRPSNTNPSMQLSLLPTDEAAGIDALLESVLEAKARKPQLGWRELKRQSEFAWSHVTLMNRCKQYARESGRYAFDEQGNVTAVKTTEA